MVKNQLNNESTKGSHFAFKKCLIVPHCILVCIRLNFFFLRNVKEMLLDACYWLLKRNRRGSFIYLFSWCLLSSSSSTELKYCVIISTLPTCQVISRKQVSAAWLIHNSNLNISVCLLTLLKKNIFEDIITWSFRLVAYEGCWNLLAVWPL